MTPLITPVEGGRGLLQPQEASVPNVDDGCPGVLMSNYARLHRDFGFPGLDEAIARLNSGLKFYESLNPKEASIHVRIDDLYSVMGAAKAFLAVVEEAKSLILSEGAGE